MTALSKSRRRSGGGQPEDLYVLWVNGIPSKCKWQELKDIIRKYCGAVNKADTIGPCHDMGYAVIPGETNAYNAFCKNNFCQRGWNGQQVEISLSGPASPGEHLDGQRMQSLPRIEPLQLVPTRPALPNPGTVSRHPVHSSQSTASGGMISMTTPPQVPGAVRFHAPPSPNHGGASAVSATTSMQLNSYSRHAVSDRSKHPDPRLHDSSATRPLARRPPPPRPPPSSRHASSAPLHRHPQTASKQSSPAQQRRADGRGYDHNSNGHRIRVNNLPTRMADADILELLSKFGSVELTSVGAEYSQNGNVCGTRVEACFASCAAAQRAIDALDDYRIGPKFLRAVTVDRASSASTSTHSSDRGAPPRHEPALKESKQAIQGPLVVDGAKSSQYLGRNRRRHGSIDSDSSEDESDDEDGDHHSASSRSSSRKISDGRTHR